MRRFMCAAEVGDEQRREDPTVLELEEAVAELTGKEAAVFLPSGTMCNIIAFFLHCRPGDEVILHRDSHPSYSENAGPAVHSRVSLCLLDGPRGIFSDDDVEVAVQPPKLQKARTRLVSVENTNNRAGGTVWPLAQVQEVCRAAARHSLATHLDGARLMNAVVASGVAAGDYCDPFDSVWIDLSKSLGCPVGAVLASSSSFIEEARRAKHLFGGAMRQAGIIAAAGIYALRHHVARLSDDHGLARELARRLHEVDGITVENPDVETNIVLLRLEHPRLAAPGFLERLELHGVRFSSVGEGRLRAVTHLDVRHDDIARAVDAVRTVVADA